MTALTLNTSKRCIELAMRDAQLISKGQLPDSEDYLEHMGRLLDLINVIQVRAGLKLWLNVDTTVALTAGTGSYTLGPGGDVNIAKPLRVIPDGCYYIDSSSNRRPITPLSWTEWNTLSQITQTGPVTQYFVDKQATRFVVHFWLVPDATAATGSAHLLLQTQVTNFTELDETINFPQEWFLALRWALADEISTGQSPDIVQKCKMSAETYMKILEDWDVEDTSVKFRPNIGMGYSMGGVSFR